MSDRILKKKYLKLCDKVFKVNKKAGLWMMFSAPHIGGIDFRNKKSLYDCFRWSATPQGWDYWDEIDDMVIDMFETWSITR